MALDNELAVGIIQSVGRYWSDNELSDCRVSVDGQVFQASRFHLSACSEFFRQVFRTESITHKENITIKGISADVFSCVIKALFTGVTGLDESNMVDVWLAANYLKIDFLVKKCEQFIEEHLTEENYLQHYKGLFFVSSVAVTNKMIRLMAQDFDMFRLTDTFLNLPSEMLIKVVETGEIKSQDNLVESVLKWASHVPKDVVGTFGLQLYHDFQDLMEKNCDDSCVNFGFSRDHVCQFVADEVIRSQILGQLIKKVKLGELSETGLKMIYEDKLAIEHQDVKDVVMLELAARVLYRTDNKAVAVYQNKQHDTSSDSHLTNEELKDKQLAKTTDIALREFNLLDLECYDIFEVPDWVVLDYSWIHIYKKPQALEDVVVFSTNHSFVMYSFEKKIFFKLFDLKETEEIKHAYVFENNLYYSTQVVRNYLTTLKITSPKKAISINKISIDRSTSVYLKYFFAFFFNYKFQLDKANLIVTRTSMRERKYDNWTTVQIIKLSNSDDPHFTFYCTLSIGNNIIFFLTGEETQIVYFDLNTHQLYSVKRIIVNYKIFEMSQRYFMLFGSGQLFEIVHREEISIIFRQQLWKGTLNMHGVFFLKIGSCDRLYVFTDKRSNIQILAKDLNIEEVIVSSFICNHQCEFMKVNRDWLNASLRPSN